MDAGQGMTGLPLAGAEWGDFRAAWHGSRVAMVACAQVRPEKLTALGSAGGPAGGRATGAYELNQMG